jgi:hypothetical protein
MTARIPFTQASLERAITAARKAGLRVTGIRPDGTLVVQDADLPFAQLELRAETAAASRWAEVKV